jgi:hypothetical protein
MNASPLESPMDLLLLLLMLPRPAHPDEALGSPGAANDDREVAPDMGAAGEACHTRTPSLV